MNISDQLSPLKKNNVKKLNDWTNNDLHSILKKNTDIDESILDHVKQSDIKGTDIINNNINDLLAKHNISNDLLNNEFEKYKSININSFNKKIEDWNNNDLLEYLDKSKNLNEKQLNVIKEKNIDGLDLMMSYHDEILEKIDNDQILFNEIKQIKAINDLTQQDNDSGELNAAISELQLETSKYKVENINLQIILDKSGAELKTIKKESQELQES